ncbi:hypothetical protein ACOSOMT5_P2058 [Acidiphilium sp. MT5]
MAANRGVGEFEHEASGLNQDRAVASINDGIEIGAPFRVDRNEMLERLRLISMRSSARLHGRTMIAETELYDEAGLPT